MKQCKECKHYSNYEVLRDLCPNGWCSRLDIPTDGDNNVCKYPKPKDAYSCSDCAKQLDGSCTTVGDKICESFELHSNEHPRLIDEIIAVCGELVDNLSQVVDIPVGNNPDKQLTWAMTNLSTTVYRSVWTPLSRLVSDLLMLKTGRQANELVGISDCSRYSDRYGCAVD